MDKMSRAISIIVILLVQNHITLAQNNDNTCGTSQLRATVIRKTLNFPADGEAAIVKGSCKWTIEADKEKTVTFTFTDITFAKDNSSCDDNRLDLYDREENSFHRITTICGNGSYGEITSTSNIMVVTMDYKDIPKGKGFRAEYMQEDKPGVLPTVNPSCGKLELQATEQNQQLIFPDDGREASGPNSCTWTIKANTGNVVQFNIIDIQFALNNDSCNKNMLMFFDGEVTKHKLITSVCGKGDHGLIFSTGVSMIVLMSYTNITKNKGFTAQYMQVNKRAVLEATCGKSDLRATGQAQTLIFPANHEPAYGPNSCTWTITAENGMVVQLNLTSIEFAPTNDTCKENYLQVYDGTVNPHKIITSVCGKGKHGAIMSTGNKMIVMMTYHGIQKGKGFTAQYMQVNVASIPHVKIALHLALFLSFFMLSRM